MLSVMKSLASAVGSLNLCRMIHPVSLQWIHTGFSDLDRLFMPLESLKKKEDSYFFSPYFEFGSSKHLLVLVFFLAACVCVCVCLRACFVRACITILKMFVCLFVCLFRLVW